VLNRPWFSTVQPQKLADAVFEAICKDVEEKALEKAKHAFRDKVFENCTKQQVGWHAKIILTAPAARHSHTLTLARISNANRRWCYATAASG
jgi:hypothetical protein